MRHTHTHTQDVRGVKVKSRFSQLLYLGPCAYLFPELFDCYFIVWGLLQDGFNGPLPVEFTYNTESSMPSYQKGKDMISATPACCPGNE